MDSDKKTFPLRTYLLSVVMTLVGCFIYSMGINLFYVPHQFISGGFTGIAMIVYYLVGFPMGILNALLNIPILFLAWKYMGKFYAFITLIGTAAISVALDLTSFMASWEVVSDPLTSAISGGVLIGTGAGVLYRYNSNSGGLDVIGAILKKYYNLEIGYVVFALNCIIVAVSAGFFSLEIAIMTLIAMYINANISSRIVIGIAQRKAAFIVSEKPYEIADSLLRDIGHGATLLYGQGAYTGGNKKIIFAIIDLTQIAKLKWIIRKVDPQAFVFIMNTTDVIGRGFTHPVSVKNIPPTPRYHAGADGSVTPTTFWQHTLEAEGKMKTPLKSNGKEK